ncbi:hypothetical protein RHS03_08551, partial [Rhizoctonia solani]
MDLPVDVFVNIASYFKLQDLMALARVNTFLRRLLMSCKSEPIWRSARLNCIDLPPRPKELSEPVYAALLFSKICTSCGRRALQNMDPVLQERLCAKCKKDQLIDLCEHDIDTSLLFVSTTILPGYTGADWSERGPWCFNKDAQAVKSVLESFDAAGNEEGKQNWIEQRRCAVKAREQDAEPLIQWFRARKMTRNAELHRLKQARKTEIENRLENLGYDKRDMNFEDCEGWFSQVYNAAPLTDKVWRELLPRLVKIIKSNHKERIESEREDRIEEITDWFRDIYTTKTYIWMMDDGIRIPWNLNATKLLSDNLEIVPEIKCLLEGDPSTEEFDERFESQEDVLTDTLNNWVNEQEARLVSMMPEDVSVPDFFLPGSKSIMLFHTDSDVIAGPMEALPLNTQKLLRADAVFVRTPDAPGHLDTCRNACYFYPKFDALPSGFAYSKLASEIAKDLLNSLGRADATYLEMMSEEHNLSCGMCPEVQSLGWKNFVSVFVQPVH